MGYAYNLSKISLDDFKNLLTTRYLIPSMRLLTEDIEHHFQQLKDHGIRTVEDLYKKTKTKKNAEQLSNETGIDLDYMVILRRMVSSYIPKPRKLEEYPDIDDGLLKEFHDIGIKTSLQLYDYMLGGSIADLVAGLEVADDTVQLLEDLMSVSRLRYVSPLFATVLVKSGYKSIDDIAGADPNKLHHDIKTTNLELQIYKGNIGDSDARFLVDDAGVFLKFE